MNDQTPAPIDDEYVEQALRDAADQRHDLPDWARHRMSNLATALRHERAKITRMREAAEVGRKRIDNFMRGIRSIPGPSAIGGMIAAIDNDFVEVLGAAAPARESKPDYACDGRVSEIHVGEPPREGYFIPARDTPTTPDHFAGAGNMVPARDTLHQQVMNIPVVHAMSGRKDEEG